MEELKRILRHAAPVLAVWLITKYGLPPSIHAPLVSLLGEFADVAAIAIGGAVGYIWSLWRAYKAKKNPA